MISVSVTGAEEIARKLRRNYAGRTFENKVKLFMERLAEYGITKAKVRIGRIVYDGTVDFNIAPIRWDGSDSLEISFEGETVGFIEFGTGIVYPDDHPVAAEMGAVRGEYGKGQGKKTGWYYKGEPGSHGVESKTTPGKIYTHGNPANKIIYRSAQDMRRQMHKIAMEVFNT